MSRTYKKTPREQDRKFIAKWAGKKPGSTKAWVGVCCCSAFIFLMFIFMVYLDRKSDHSSHVALLAGISAMMAVISAMVVSIQVTVFEPMVREIYRLKEEIEDLKSKSPEPSEQS